VTALAVLAVLAARVLWDITATVLVAAGLAGFAREIWRL
jgi:hypothetical protein